MSKTSEYLDAKLDQLRKLRRMLECYHIRLITCQSKWVYKSVFEKNETNILRLKTEGEFPNLLHQISVLKIEIKNIYTDLLDELKFEYEFIEPK